MNKVIIGLNIVLLTAIVGLYVLHFNKKDKIAYVDSVKLLNEYQGMVDARAVYEKKVKGWQSNIDTLTAEVQETIKKHEKESNGMSVREKTLSEELIRTKQQQLISYQKAMQEKAQQEDVNATQQIVLQVNEFLKKYGASQDYKIIFAATQSGNIVYAEDMLDVTDEVLSLLNQQYQIGG